MIEVDVDTKKKIEETIQRLLHNDKPKIIAGKFENILDLDGEKLKHFRSGNKFGKYVWQTTTHIKDDEYKGLHMGLLLDEDLNYVHIVFVSTDVLNYILKL
jgi:hypothetical protein